MDAVRCVLLVHNEADAFGGLEEMLRDQQVRTHHAHHCAEARCILSETRTLDVVLTAAKLADGTWEDVIRLVRKTARHLPVIVMSRVVSMRLYLDTQDGGAADFIAPPVQPRDLAHVLTSAVHRKVPRRSLRSTPERAIYP